LPNLQAVNSVRSRLPGINSRPLPAGQVTRGAHELTTVSASGGRKFVLRSNGTLRSLTVGKARETLRHNGRVATFHNGTVDAIHGVHGGLTVAAHGQQHTLIVSRGPRRGYIQRPVDLMGMSYVIRTYVQGERRTVRLYKTYNYRGAALNYYIPAAYYPTAFYTWAYNPWAAPVVFAWPFTSAPWYTSYASYFQESRAYTGPAAWLADYAVSSTLADAYGAAQDAPLRSDEQVDDSLPPADDELAAQYDTRITESVKLELTQAADQELVNDSNVASDSAKAGDYEELANVLQPNHTFVADTDLDVATRDHRSCYVSAGNVLRLTPESAAAPGAAVELVVVASRRGDCPAGTPVLISLDALQEMENAFRVRLNDGLAALRQLQGRNGMPAAPAAALAASSPEAYPPADTDDLDGMLASTLQQNTQAEATMASQAFTGGAGK
jgi:hypothetical protein